MKHNKTKTIIAIFSMLLSIGLYAQGPRGRQGRGQGQRQGNQRGGKPDASQIVSKLDLNNDEVIDKDEASKDRRGKIAEDFELIDTNGDELISLEELKASLGNRGPRKKKISPEELIKTVDDDGSNTLNELEVAAKKKNRLVKNFKIIDTNGDNELSLDELKTFYSNSKPKKRN